MDRSIVDFGSFCEKLLEYGFSMGGGNAKGIFAAVDFAWDDMQEGSPVRWHTGELDTDPWEWRMRVLEERNDIAYAKVFFRSSGYITREFYPYFLAVRRRGRTFEQCYADGTVSRAADRLYKAISRCGALATHEMAAEAGFSKQEKSALTSALLELQMGLFVTMCGRKRKNSVEGEPYGWNSTVFCTTEEFWGEDITARVAESQAYDTIRDRILALNPSASEKNIKTFICGK